MHTGSRAFCVLMALAAAGTEMVSAAAPSAPSYRVEAKLFSVPQADASSFTDGFYSSDLVGRLVTNPKASLLTCPSVTAGVSMPSTIDVTQVQPLPHARPREVGVTLTVMPGLKSPSSFQVSCQIVRFLGFADRHAAPPIFKTQRCATTLSLDVPQPGDGYYCVDLPQLTSGRQTYEADGRKSASLADANERQLLFVKISRG